ncbi:murein hydrolase activator NlpD [Pasteurella dagmatis]|uniref:Peptidase, M23 family n=1 Tax=Pasteurella dagmatis ATCC 43325 TaxID=667128 RepID=C9PP66_9PAST|nr:murein hydrolase activator NlpD [Pasteurella dagmatis]EEX50564.1 peptidase, M23 family [Pasteurella dagmatis ATCC 43325]SNV79766.1 outer membrane antigenic lipoprotein B [Pasteurella dagmatis]
MRKSFLLLPISIAMLSACTSNAPAPVESVDGTLTPGIMQPVDSSSSGGTWEPQIQQSGSMPAGMNQPVYQPTSTPTQPMPTVTQPVVTQPVSMNSQQFDIPRNPSTGQPDYSKIVKGSYRGETYTVRKGDSMYLIAYISGLTVPELAALNNMSQPYTLSTGQVLRVSNGKNAYSPSSVAPVASTGAPAPVTKGITSQHFDIPRNPNTNTPDYSKIDKGFYKGETYTVRKGDTMYLIAYISGLDVKDLAALNNMSEPYRLAVGQTLRVSNGKPVQTAVVTQPVPQPVSKPVEQEVTYTPGPNGTQYGSDGSVIGPIKSGAGTPSAPVQTSPVNQPVAHQPVPVPTNETKQVMSSVAWQWPTKGNITQGFSTADGGNKGLDIAGSRGQSVNAAAAGRVVYAGNALRGYGNLIIIKHNDDYLSAYAHNESILVKDQQEVSAGQQIAKMGSSGTNSVKLHFEIRYKGKSVDPMRYLPKR